LLILIVSLFFVSPVTLKNKSEIKVATNLRDDNQDNQYNQYNQEKSADYEDSDDDDNEQTTSQERKNDEDASVSSSYSPDNSNTSIPFQETEFSKLKDGADLNSLNAATKDLDSASVSLLEKKMSKLKI